MQIGLLFRQRVFNATLAQISCVCSPRSLALVLRTNRSSFQPIGFCRVRQAHQVSSWIGGLNMLNPWFLRVNGKPRNTSNPPGSKPTGGKLVTWVFGVEKGFTSESFEKRVLASRRPCLGADALVWVLVWNTEARVTQGLNSPSHLFRAANKQQPHS